MRTLRRSTPPILRYTPLVAALAMALAPHAAQATNIQVTTHKDDGTPGSLREAIEAFNDSEGTACTGTNDSITFNITDAGTGPFTIALSSPLPALQCGGLTINGGSVVTIQGQDQTSGFGCGLDVYFMPSPPNRIIIRNLAITGFSYGTAVCGNVDVIRSKIYGNDTGIAPHLNSVIDQNEIHTNCTGIYVEYGGTDIRRNAIYNNCTGIDVYSVDSVHIADNRIGLDLANAPASNSYEGVYIYNSRASIEGNFIAANGTGIYLDQAYEIGITGNFIGTDPTGMTAIGNSVGIYSGAFSYGADITSNVISGNSGAGIEMSDVFGVNINGNKIGTNVNGSSALPNGYGITAFCGLELGITNNTISGNNGEGIWLGNVEGGGSMEISGNKIGVQGDGVTALGNNAYGILLTSDSCYGGAVLSAKRERAKTAYAKRSVVKSTNSYVIADNTIANNGFGGVGIFDGNSNNLTGNTIRNNGGDGVLVSFGTGNQIVQNAIYDNTGKNINLGFFGGPLPNDAGDGDSGGGNNLQNYPVVGPVIRGAGNTTVNFFLDSVPDQTYRIDVYSNSSSVPGGKVHHGNTNLPVVTGGSAGSFAIASTTVDNISLTATSPSGDTSEFSPVATVVTTPSATVNPTGIDFGNVAVGGRSADRQITITSTGTAPYRIDTLRADTCYGGSAICYGGPFICSTNCVEGSNMPKPASCTITAAFAPTGLGGYATTMRLCDNTADSPRDIVLTGNGVVPPPVNIEPQSWNFGSTLVGKQSDPKTFVISNPGTTAVPIGRVATTGDFLLQGTTCESQIPPGGSCAADVAFAPLVQGPLDGTLEVTAGSPPPPEELPGAAPAKRHGPKVAATGATARLSGLGTAEADATLPTSVDMGTQTRGEAPLTRAITMGNNGNRGLEISSISTAAPFSVTHDCPPILPPGNSCTIRLSYSSNVLGTFNGRLTVITNSSTGSGAIALLARTVEVAAPLLRLSAANMGFGDRLFGTTSPTQRVTITNIGNSPATFGSIVTSNLNFLVSGTTCGLTLAVGAECGVDVAMRPAGFGLLNGLLLVNSNATGSPHEVALAGSGCRPFTGAGARTGERKNCAP